MPGSILLMGRAAGFADRMQPLLASLGRAFVRVRARPGAIHDIDAASVGLTVLDFGRGDAETGELVRELREALPESALLAIADPAGASSAVGLMNAGVDDYVITPPQAADLRARCQRLLEDRQLHRRLELLQAELDRRYGARRIVCRSSAMQAVYQRVLQLAPTKATVLITGESGAGKELVARSLHYNSKRGDQPFVAMNCGAVAETLVESELFGHERGAFTGAVASVPGKFELADGGTLFLDEVGSMGLATQVRLLRVLEEGELMRVGGRRTLQVDVRLLAATNTDLEEQVRRGEFREDLLYRLKVATIQVPPLRKRRDDIPPLARTFVDQLCEDNELGPKELAPDALSILAAHDWPGNVRELKNLLESLVITVGDDVIRPDHLPALSGRTAEPVADDPPEAADVLTLEEVERRHVERTLRRLGGNRTQAARQLGIGVRTLQRKIRRWALDVPPPSATVTEP